MLVDVNSSNNNKLILKVSEAVDCRTRKKVKHIIIDDKLSKINVIENYRMTSKINYNLSY